MESEEEQQRTPRYAYLLGASLSIVYKQKLNLMYKWPCITLGNWSRDQMLTWHKGCVIQFFKVELAQYAEIISNKIPNYFNQTFALKWLDRKWALSPHLD